MTFLSQTFYAATCVLLAAVTISSCQHDPYLPDGWVPPIDPPVDTPGQPLDPCDPDSVYFTNTILPLLNSSCAIPGCHDAGTAEDGVILTSYSLIISTGDIVPGNPSASEVYENITEDDPDKVMPPPGSGVPPLTPDQIMDIFTWIQQGAQNNGCDGCDTTAVTFSGSIFPLIQTTCTGCHSGPSPQGGLSLTNYAQVAASANSGILMNSLNGTGGIVPMPFNQPTLSDCAKRTVQIWIEDGTPNN